MQNELGAISMQNEVGATVNMDTYMYVVLCSVAGNGMLH